VRPSDIKCRLCGHHYGEEAGCPTCSHAKRAIDWPATAEVEIDLLGLSRKAVRLIEMSLDRLERDMTKWSKADREDGFYHQGHAKEAAMLGRSLAFMLAEARKLEERDEKRVANMGYAERVELWMDFLDSLPQEHQRNVIRSLSERPWIAGLLETDADLVS
jgi:hypothetical protein